MTRLCRAYLLSRLPGYTGAIVALCLATNAEAQFSAIAEHVLIEQQQPRSIKIATDGSIWIIASHDNELEFNQNPFVYRSTDKGINWSTSIVQSASSKRNAIWDIAPIDSLNAFIAAWTAGLFITSDGGRSWSRVQSYPYACAFVHFFDPNTGWAFSGRLYHSLWDVSPYFIHSVTSDGGRTWTHIGGEEWNMPTGTSLPILDTTEIAGAWNSMSSGYDCSEESILIGMRRGSYWVSNDRGYHWSRGKSPLADSGLVTTLVAIQDSAHFIVAGGLPDNSYQYIRTNAPLKRTLNLDVSQLLSFGTKDGGQHWISGRPSINRSILASVTGTPGHFMIAGSNNDKSRNGIAITEDFGSHWTLIDSASITVLAAPESQIMYGVQGHNFTSREKGDFYSWGGHRANTATHFLEWLPWAVLLLVLITGILFYILSNKRNRRTELALQLTELERTALRAQMNPHFIFNSLNSLQSFINNNEVDNSNIFLSYFSRLIRGVMKASSEKEIVLSTEIELLESYLELEKIRFESQFDYTLDVDKTIEPHLIKVPPLITQPLVENAIIHGVTKGSSKGLIELSYTLRGGTLIITVKDNGIGFYQSTKNLDPNHKSIGLTNTQKRLKLIDEENEMEINEEFDEMGNVIGTKVVQYIHLKGTKMTK